MKLQTALLVFLGVVFLETSHSAADKDNANEVDKRRGWGKRFSPSGDSDTDTDNALEGVDKRRGWGKRFTLDSGTAAEEVDKRRGWGKRFSPSDSAAGLSSTEVDKRRGWGKRALETDSEVDKRRGWGKRSPMDEDEDKRGWGKRGWGKRATGDNEEEFEVDSRGWGKRYGWGKRGWGKRSDNEVCAVLRKEVLYLLSKAIEAETQRIRQCDGQTAKP